MEILNLEKNGFYKLKDLKNFKIAKPDSDVRGWNVYSCDKKNIGIIEDILVDPISRRASYLDIYLHHDIKIKNEDRHLFVPVNLIRPDIKTKAVYLKNIKTVISLRITEPSDTENQGYQPRMSEQNYLSQIGDDVYNNKLFDEDNFHKIKERKLYRLKELDNSAIFDNFPDIRNWCVITSDSIDIGRIDDILIDKESEKVRYLDVKIYEGPIFDTERHILVPIGLSELIVNDNKIKINIDSNDFVNYPPYHGEEINEYENNLFNLLKYDDNSLYT